jgi:hypothetical protein
MAMRAAGRLIDCDAGHSFDSCFIRALTLTARLGFRVFGVFRGLLSPR